MKISAPLLGVLLFLPTLQVSGLEGQVAGDLTLEIRGFSHEAVAPGQGRNDASFSFNPEFYRDWNRGRSVITFEPFLRVDANDSQRTHFDIRDLSFVNAWDRWELRVGLRQVFWGVTESQHLVDIINQTDLVENSDGEDKLGQPMLNLAWISDVGTFDLFLMTGFRERTFPGVDGRLRPHPAIETEAARYESGAQRWRGEVAGRWSHYLGSMDLGASVFHGNSREPQILPEPRGSSADQGIQLTPFYPLITQLGVDAQWTQGPWLWKFEGITRDGPSVDRFWALTGGFEYTLFQFMGTNTDVGLVAEILLDDRGSEAPTPFEDDVFIAFRLAFNDVQSTELLAGIITDRGDGGTLLNVEGNRRLGSAWRVELQARGFLGIEDTDVLYAFRKDDYLSLSLSRFF